MRRFVRPGAERAPLTAEQQEFLSKWVGLPAMPKERPAYARLILAPDGRTWVWPNRPMQRWIPSEELQRQTGASVAWELPVDGGFDVFAADGEWLGHLPLPAEVAYSGYPDQPGVVIRGDTLWAVTRDSLGVNYVTRYSVDWK